MAASTRRIATVLLVPLRDGIFLTRRRLTAYPLLLLGACALALLWLLVTARGLNDYSGRPLGTDFSSFYAAGKLALAGKNPFDQQSLYHAEQAAFGIATPYFAFSYPPIFLLLIAPLALLPYAAALILWLVLSFALYLTAMTALRRRCCNSFDEEKTLYLLAVFAFPAVFINLVHGQNGFLASALMVLGLLHLDKRPLLAGLCFGCLAFKPQLGLVLPFALAAGGRWKSIGAATFTVLVLALFTVLLFGADAWRNFFAAAQFSRAAILEEGAVGYEKMVSLFAAFRLWRAPLPLAYGAQVLVALTAVLATMRLWRSAADFRLKSAALLLATLLATPFALDYDLMLLAPALALLAAEGRDHGFRPFELSLLTFLWLVPLVSRDVAMATHILLAPLAILALLAMIRRPVKA